MNHNDTTMKQIPHGLSINDTATFIQMPNFCLNTIDEEMNEIVNRMVANGGVRNSISRSDSSSTSTIPEWLQGGLKSINLDIGLYEHVSCRLPLLSSIHNRNEKINVYLCSVSDKIVVIAAEEDGRKESEDSLDNTTRMYRDDDGDNNEDNVMKYNITSLQ